MNGSVNVYSLQRLAERDAEAAKAGTPSNIFAPVDVRDMREMRLLAGLDFAQLGERAGVSPCTVSRIESGRFKHLKGLTLEKIAIALKHALQDRGVPIFLSVPEIELIVIRGKK